MEADLYSVVGTNILKKIHMIYIFYQILKALKFMHAVQLIHRDLKPSNILIDSHCNVKICDFGLVRSLASPNQLEQEAVLSEQVATKWYRAPELLLGSRSYDKPVDIWSYGCIVAQLLIGKSIFEASSTLNQLQKILDFTGPITRDDIQSINSPNAPQVIAQAATHLKGGTDFFETTDPDFHPLIRSTLRFNPNSRLNVDQLLRLAIFRDFEDDMMQDDYSSLKPILPRANDNIRYSVKFYRDQIYNDIIDQHRLIKNQQTKQNRQKIRSKIKSKALSVKKKISPESPKSFSKYQNSPYVQYGGQKTSSKSGLKRTTSQDLKTKSHTVLPKQPASPSVKAPLSSSSVHRKLKTKVSSHKNPFFKNSQPTSLSSKPNTAKHGLKNTITSTPSYLQKTQSLTTFPQRKPLSSQTKPNKRYNYHASHKKVASPF